MTAAATTAIYVRMSQDRAGGGLGIARQEKDCRALAKRIGLRVGEVYTDNDMSASSGKPRPGYLRMLEDIKAGSVSNVLSWHTDRLHRSPVELEQFIDVCQSVPTHTVQAGPLDLSTPAGRMVARQLGAVAKYEVEIKSERQKSKNRQMAEAGQPRVGARPFGFEQDAMTHHKKEADELRRMVRSVLAGDSLASVMKDLDSRGVTTTRGGSWTYSGLRALLTRPRNAGLYQYQGQVVGQGSWQPVISEEDHLAVCRLLADPSRRTTTGNNRKHLLSGLVICGKCDKPMKAGSVRSRGVKYDLYRCCVHRSRGKVDAHVTRIVLMLLDDERIAMALAKSEDIDTSGLMAERSKAKAKLASYATMLDDDDMTPEQFKVASKKVRDRISDIEDELASASRQSAFGDLLNTDNVLSRWESLPLDRKRAVINALVTVTVLPVGSKGRGPQPIQKSVRVRMKQNNSSLIGGTMPAELLDQLVSALT